MRETRRVRRILADYPRFARSQMKPRDAIMAKNKKNSRKIKYLHYSFE